MQNHTLYMTEATYNYYANRARRLAELDAPPIIQQNEQRILDSAVLVQTDEEGWDHFPAAAGTQDTDSWLDEDCGCKLIIPRYIDEDELPCPCYVDDTTLRLALDLARQNNAGQVYVLYCDGMGDSAALQLPADAMGTGLNELLRVAYDAQNILAGRLHKLAALPAADGSVLARTGALLYRAQPDEECPREQLLGDEGSLRLDRRIRYMMQSYDPCLAVLPESALDNWYSDDGDAEADDRCDEN